ncbi:hypothetical protein K7432_005296 [Basidiobolus ranarum]|uniref:Pentatricopeptide repeat-containing protein n=1 Tax=Basidiobolus ranarum TaxID=34480 RepID=A0ABR2WWV3_9FUNG
MLPTQVRLGGILRTIPFNKGFFVNNIFCSQKSLWSGSFFNAYKVKPKISSVHTDRLTHDANNQLAYLKFNTVVRSIHSKAELSFDQCIKSALEKDNVNAAIQIFWKIRKVPGFIPTSSLQADLLELLNKCSLKLYRDVTLDIYRFLRSTGHIFPVSTYGTVLSVLKSKDDGALVLQIYREMLQCSVLPDVNVLNMLLLKLDLNSDITYTLNEFERVGIEYDNTTYDIMISKFIGKDYDQAMYWYRKMESSGCSAKEYLYYSIIKLNFQHGHPDAAHSTFETLMKYQRPALTTLSLMILEHCRLNMMTEASHYFHVMRKYRGESTIQIYQALIDGFLRQADLESAIGVYSHMNTYYPSYKISPDTYTRMISASTKSHDMPTAKWLFDEMTRCGINANEYTYSVMIAGYGRVRNGPGIDQMYEAIRLNPNIEPDIALYNSLLNAYNWVGNIRMVLQLYDSIQAGRLTPNNVTVSIVLDSCGRHNALYRAQVMWNRLKHQNFPMNCNNYTSYIEALGRNGESLKAMELAYSIEDAGLRPDLKFFTTLLSFLRRDGHQREIRKLGDLLSTKYPELFKILERKIANS